MGRFAHAARERPRCAMIREVAFVLALGVGFYVVAVGAML